MRSQTRLALLVSIALCWPWDQLLRLTEQYPQQFDEVIEGCQLPWHCPCTEQHPQLHHYVLQQQQQRKRYGSSSDSSSQLQKRREAAASLEAQRHIQSLAGQMKQATGMLLKTFRNHRFRDEWFADRLEICAINRTNNCLAEFLAECRLDRLPHINEIDIINLSDWNQPYSPNQQQHRPSEKNAAIVPQVQDLLSRLAEYVDQAHRDEIRMVPDQSRTLANNMSQIQLNGIYAILCNLRLLADQPTPTGTSIMLYKCQNLASDARTHNRNYMIFFVLDRLLDRIGNPSISNYKSYRKFNRKARASISQQPAEWDYVY